MFDVMDPRCTWSTWGHRKMHGITKQLGGRYLGGFWQSLVHVMVNKFVMLWKGSSEPQETRLLYWRERRFPFQQARRKALRYCSASPLDAIYYIPEGRGTVRGPSFCLMLPWRAEFLMFFFFSNLFQYQTWGGLRTNCFCAWRVSCCFGQLFSKLLLSLSIIFYLSQMHPNAMLRLDHSHNLSPCTRATKGQEGCAHFANSLWYCFNNVLTILSSIAWFGFLDFLPCWPYQKSDHVGVLIFLRHLNHFRVARSSSLLICRPMTAFRVCDKCMSIRVCFFSLGKKGFDTWYIDP